MQLRLASLLGLVALAGPTRARAESAIAPYVIISDVSVTEGDSGTTPFTAQVRLTGYYSPIPVDIAAMVDTANADDFEFTTTHLTLVPDGPPQTVSGVIVGDLDPEGNESFRLAAVNGPTSAYVFSAGGQVTIVDDDSARAPHVTAKGFSVREGDQGTTTANLEVHLDRAGTLPVTVGYAAHAGSASADSDYRVTPGTLTFAPGELVKAIPVEILGDAEWERDETFTVELTNPHRAVLTDTSATITISNDDPAGHVTLDDQRLTEGTGGGYRTIALTIRSDRPFPPFAKVWVSTAGGAARPGQDFLPRSMTLYPQAGTTSVTFDLSLVADAAPECDEGFSITYGAHYTGDETSRTAHVIIVDDDGGPTDAAACPDPFTAPPGDPPPDAGSPFDAAADVPPPGDDFDPRVVPDAGPVSFPDVAPLTIDAAVTTPAAGKGGGCVLGGRGPAPAALLLALAIFAPLLRRRRR